jgi:general secretion pathway protein J
MKQRGFTLIELLIACALMAVLALLSWRGLDSVLQSRERLVVASDELRSLTLAFAQMDEDLLRSWPVRQLHLGEPQLRIGVTGDDNHQSLHLIREVNRSGFPTRVQRVVYEVRNQQLARGFSQYGRAETGNLSVGGDAVQSIIWQPILGSVRGIAFRGWVDGRGWMDASAVARTVNEIQQLENAGPRPGPPPGMGLPGRPPPPGDPSGNPAGDRAEQLAITGVELVVERMDGQRFIRVFSVKD